MINIDKILFGYVVIQIDERDVTTVINRMIKAGLNQKIDKKGKMQIPYRNVRAYKGLLSGIVYTSSSVRGALGLLLRLKGRFGILCSIAVFLLVLSISFNTVWDIRIEGCTDIDSNAIISELEDAGLKVGAFWFGIDKRECENKVLLSSDNISWISINRRGTVAYVSVIERNSHTYPQAPIGYASLVADRDCIIEEITVESGYPVVKVGDTVRKGEVLISGVIPQSLGGGFCYAEGIVKGRYVSEVEVHAEKETVKKEYIGSSLYTFSVKLLGFKINIFKNYGNMPINYDIISKNKEFIFLGKKIPLSLEYEIAKEFSERTVEIGYLDMVRSASEELSRILSEDLAAEELLAIKTDISEDSGYSIIARLVLRAEVTKTKEFEYISENQ